MKGYISYAHADRRQVSAFRTHLKATEKAYDFSFWQDDSIQAGQRWDQHIRDAISDADVFLLMVSPSYLASDFVFEYELPAIRARVDSGRGLICPVVLAPCAWNLVGSNRQAIPVRNGHVTPISAWRSRNDGYDLARQQIDAAISAYFGISFVSAAGFGLETGLNQGPEGPLGRETNGQFILERVGGDSDTPTATDFPAEEMQAKIIELAGTLLSWTLRQSNSFDSSWMTMIEDVRRLAEILAMSLDQVENRVVELGAISVNLAAYLRRNRKQATSRTEDPAPLSYAIVNVLEDLVGSLTPWLRLFPAAQSLDESASVWIADPARSDPVNSRQPTQHPPADDKPVKRISKRTNAPRIVDASLHPLIDGHPPDWASIWGQDGNGVYAGFSIGAVTQLMRWIPPGRFMMGSPEDEPGRFDWEGPRHPVVLAEGFWLFDTPCTQALWEEVLGENPSRFRSPTRPVEQVGFDDARRFIEALNSRVTDLSLTLPSEAQWEYACRAGTETATYAGPIEILDMNNALILDAIAWYGGNSGVGFELDEGADSSGWSGKQYDHTKAGTHPVKGRLPNGWGLYDMLGNVWEWCADEWHDTYRRAPRDGSAWIGRRDGAAHRVVRGGSWDDGAGRVRAACRDRIVPAFRYDFLGFRCARVQA